MSETEKLDNFLNSAEEDFNEGDLAPTETVVKVMKKFLEASKSVDCPKVKYFSADFKGGLEAYYRFAKKHLQLIITPFEDTLKISLFCKAESYCQLFEIGGRRDLFISKLVWLKTK